MRAGEGQDRHSKSGGLSAILFIGGNRASHLTTSVLVGAQMGWQTKDRTAMHKQVFGAAPNKAA
jgi:hypothetical protein